MDAGNGQGRTGSGTGMEGHGEGGGAASPVLEWRTCRGGSAALSPPSLNHFVGHKQGLLLFLGSLHQQYYNCFGCYVLRFSIKVNGASNKRKKTWVSERESCDICLKHESDVAE